MSEKNSAQNIIQSYRKRQQMGPFVIGGLAVVLVIVGILILAVWLTGENRPALNFLASKTPTATATLSPTPVTPTSTLTITPTETLTPTITETPTRSGPVQYTVVEGDICWDIAQRNQVDITVLLAINNFEPGTCPIKVGDKIWIPTIDQKLDTPTPVPSDFRGEITYSVLPGDSLASIADEFLTTVEDLMTRNKITDANTIFVGQQLKVRVNIATRVPTRAATSTSAPALGTAAAPAATVTPTNTQIP